MKLERMYLGRDAGTIQLPPWCFAIAYQRVLNLTERRGDSDTVADYRCDSLLERHERNLPSSALI